MCRSDTAVQWFCDKYDDPNSLHLIRSRLENPSRPLLTCTLPNRKTSNQTMRVSLSAFAAACFLPSGGSLAFSVVDRRRALATAFGGSTAALVVAHSNLQQSLIEPAIAADSVPTKEELDRIVQGYKQINYLLEHFDVRMTTTFDWICALFRPIISRLCSFFTLRKKQQSAKKEAEANANGTPTPFVELSVWYVWFLLHSRIPAIESSCTKSHPHLSHVTQRTTTDPLFQIDKVFAKIKNMDTIDPDKLEDLFEATEEWSAAMAMSNSMAYVSQFGEYNPGGGEDNVLKYLLEAKKQVESAQKALGVIVAALGLSV